MPDITMCKNAECEKRKDCYRFMATPSEYRQSYFMDVKPDENGVCEYFWDLNKQRYPQMKKESRE